MNYYYDDMASEAPTYEDIGSSEPTARKSHVCDVCKKEIAIGTKYYKHVYKSDGELVQFKAHSRYMNCWDDGNESDEMLPF